MASEMGVGASEDECDEMTEPAGEAKYNSEETKK